MNFPSNFPSSHIGCSCTPVKRIADQAAQLASRARLCRQFRCQSLLRCSCQRPGHGRCVRLPHVKVEMDCAEIFHPSAQHAFALVVVSIVVVIFVVAVVKFSCSISASGENIVGDIHFILVILVIVCTSERTSGCGCGQACDCPGGASQRAEYVCVDLAACKHVAKGQESQGGRRHGRLPVHGAGAAHRSERRQVREMCVCVLYGLFCS